METHLAGVDLRKEVAAEAGEERQRADHQSEEEEACQSRARDGAGDAVAIGIDRRVVRLLGGGEQRDRGFAPAQGHLEVLVRLHHLPHRLVARALELLLGDAPLRSSDPEPVAAQAAVEDRQLDRNRRAVGGLVDARPAGNARSGCSG